MTQTPTTTDDSAMIAAVVDEYTVDIVTNRAQIARARKNPPAPIVRTVTNRTGHWASDCSRIDQDRIVGFDIDIRTAEAGMPCDYCWPREADMTPRVADDPTGPAYDGARPSRRGGAPAVSNEPTDKQVAFLHRLFDEHVGGDWDVYVATMRSNNLWTKPFVSRTIDALMSVPKVTTPAPAATTSTVPAGVEILNRSNRYGGSCVLCGGYVADDAGRLAKQNGRWVVAHNDGECGEPTTASPVSSGYRDDVPEGHYAIPSTGDNDLAFYRVDRPSDGRWAGRVFVKMIVGGHPDSPVAQRNIAGILDRIADAGVEASARLYGQEIGRCCRCNRTLTDETSRANGIGPECASKSGF